MKPAVTVVVTAPRGSPGFGRTLHSLAVQSLPSGRFEVVMVSEGSDDAVAGAFAEASRRYPALALRRVRTSRVDPPRGRNLGTAAARGGHVTYLTAGETVSPRFLEALLAHAGPDVVAAARRVDAPPAAPLPLDKPRLLGPQLAADELGACAGKLLPTALCRAVGFDEGLAAAEACAEFLARLFAAYPLSLRLCPLSARAVVYGRGEPMADVDPFELDVTRPLDLVERLEVAAATAARPEVLTEATERQAGRVNRFLRRCPDRHPDVLAEIRMRGLGSLPYARVNRGVARDLAVLYAALPYADISANVAARRIRARGLPVDVVCADLATTRGLDAGADLIWREYVDGRHEIPGQATMGGGWARIASFCRLGLARIEELERAKGRYRSVYSRTMFPASHLLAGWHKSRRPACRWTAEFSDPQLKDIKGETRTSAGRVDHDLLHAWGHAITAAGFDPPHDDNLWVWTELLAYALADEIVFTNPDQRDFMLGYCGDRRLAERALARSVVQPHPLPPAELYRAVQPEYRLEPGRIHIAYFGVFYATRGLTEVVEALRSLDAAVRDRIRLHVFTPDPAELLKEAHEMGLDGTVAANPYVGYLAFLNLTTRFDVLLVNDARACGVHGVNPYLPSKYADYAGSGTPVWGVVEPGSPLSARALDFVSVLGDVAGARDVLERVAGQAACQTRTQSTYIAPRLA